MDLIKNKIDKFQINCYQTAVAKAKEIENKVNTELLDDTKNEVKAYEIEAKNNFEKNMSKLDHAYNTEIFKQQNEAKMKILDKKRKIKEDIQIEVISNLTKFIASRKYITFLIKNIKEALKSSKVGKKDKAVIYVTKKDFEKYEKRLKKEFNYEFLKLENENLGGSKCFNQTKNIFVDNTLKTLILEECNG